ncbi:MAG: Crp/Fnr family transcriptional regulator [Bacillota bacterium]|jgi:CRP-like cAMP-binding protein
MQKYFSELKNIALFAGIHDADIPEILQCLGGYEKKYTKGEFIFDVGDRIDEVGILLAGKLQIIKDDVSGNRNILQEYFQIGTFAESLSFSALPHSPFSVIASQDCEILFIPLNRVLNVCSAACSFHTRMLENSLRMIANENILFNEKIDIISQRSIRDKIMRYLLLQSEKKSSDSFTIPFSRNELADYICVDRSALSRELSKMSKEGIIEFTKSDFTIRESSKKMQCVE